MKKASEITILVGFIFGIISALILLGCTIGFFVASSAKEMIAEGIQNGTIHTNLPGTLEEQVAVVQLIFVSLASGFLVGFLLTVAMCVVTMVANSKKTSGLYIAAIVLSVLGGNVVSLVGSILGLVSLSEAKSQQ